MSPEPVSPAIDRHHRDEALAVLFCVSRWRLPAQVWNDVATAVGNLASALASGDVDAAEAAVVDLEMLSDDRAGGIGEPSDEPAPPQVRDISVYLIHSLGGDTQDDADEAVGGGQDTSNG
ncbi:CATRA system-associated protein [Streptomyces sp. NPDC048288]|uniref:CATRA system-associated protein n=1 Tax=Streptomyces sp. NPDC048288 TaxID=3365529 RepID=UPI00371D21DA